MINYGKQNITNEDINSVVKTLKSQFLTQGPIVKKFEQDLKKTFKSKYAVAVSSGTAALNLVAKILNWKKDDLVIVSPITFLSSSNCVIRSGATPVFVDINLDDYSLDLKEVEKKILFYRKKGKKIKAIVVTDYAGNPSNWKELSNLKSKYRFQLVNDNCHAMGSAINNNYGYAIKYADLVTLSFHPVKNITTGEGGAILTNSFKFSKYLKSLRSHGVIRNKYITKKFGSWYYEMRYLGENYRMPDINAALGISQLKRLNKFVKKRQFIAKFYDSLFTNKKIFTTPKVRKGYTHSYHLYPLLIKFNKIKISKQNLFSKFLKEKIKLNVHYIPVNSQPYYKKKFKFKKQEFPNSNYFYKNQISLPIYYDLSIHQLEYIKKKFKKILKIDE